MNPALRERRRSLARVRPHVPSSSLFAAGYDFGGSSGQGHRVCWWDLSLRGFILLRIPTPALLVQSPVLVSQLPPTSGCRERAQPQPRDIPRAGNGIHKETAEPWAAAVGAGQGGSTCSHPQIYVK